MKTLIHSKIPVLLLFVALCTLLLVSYQVTTAPQIECAERNSWVESLSDLKNQWKNYSQLGEDGLIDTIFKNIGTSNKIYVEFGVENCAQCNTRYLREHGWDVKNSLLMDGGHKNEEINLQQVIFWPSNILDHFKKFKVPQEFDLLSVDTDAYDWFMIEAILKGGYSPRVIVTEWNANFEKMDAKSVLPPSDRKSWERWDGTTYHGSSMLALYYLFNRFGYSLLFCNLINCFAVRDTEFDVCVRRPIDDIYVKRGWGRGHRCDYSNRSMAVIDPTGYWTGKDDNGEGSPMVRHTGCVAGVLKNRPYIDSIKQATDPARK